MDGVLYLLRERASAGPFPMLGEVEPPSSDFTRVGLKPNLVRLGRRWGVGAAGWEPMLYIKLINSM